MRTCTGQTGGGIACQEVGKLQYENWHMTDALRTHIAPGGPLSQLYMLPTEVRPCLQDPELKWPAQNCCARFHGCACMRWAEYACRHGASCHHARICGVIVSITFHSEVDEGTGCAAHLSHTRGVQLGGACKACKHSPLCKCLSQMFKVTSD